MVGKKLISKYQLNQKSVDLLDKYHRGNSTNYDWDALSEDVDITFALIRAFDNKLNWEILSKTKNILSPEQGDFYLHYIDRIIWDEHIINYCDVYSEEKISHWIDTIEEFRTLSLDKKLPYSIFHKFTHAPYKTLLTSTFFTSLINNRTVPFSNEFINKYIKFIPLSVIVNNDLDYNYASLLENESLLDIFNTNIEIGRFLYETSDKLPEKYINIILDKLIEYGSDVFIQVIYDFSGRLSKYNQKDTTNQRIILNKFLLKQKVIDTFNELHINIIEVITNKYNDSWIRSNDPDYHNYQLLVKFSNILHKCSYEDDSIKKIVSIYRNCIFYNSNTIKLVCHFDNVDQLIDNLEKINITSIGQKLMSMTGAELIKYRKLENYQICNLIESINERAFNCEIIFAQPNLDASTLKLWYSKFGQYVTDFAKSTISEEEQTRVWTNFVQKYISIHVDLRTKDEKIKEMEDYARRYNLEFDGEYIYGYRSHNNNGNGAHSELTSYKVGTYYSDWHCDLRKDNFNSFGLGMWPTKNLSDCLCKVKVSVDDWGCVVNESGHNAGKARVKGFTFLEKLSKKLITSRNLDQ